MNQKDTKSEKKASLVPLWVWNIPSFILGCLKDIYFWVSFVVVSVIGVSIIYTIGSTNTNDWIGYWGNIAGGIIGGVVTMAGIKITFQQQNAKELMEVKKYWVEFDIVLVRAINYLGNIIDLYPSNKDRFIDLVNDRLSSANNECQSCLLEYGDILKQKSPFYYRRFVGVFNYLNNSYGRIMRILQLEANKPSNEQILELIKNTKEMLQKEGSDIYNLLYKEKII